METDSTIVAKGLSKHFGKKHDGIQALDNVSFSVPKESVFCILGPNGAGKTTLLRILTTVSKPDRGSAWIEGYDISSQALAVRNCIGIVAQENRFDKYLSIWHNLTMHAQMHGIPRAVYEPEIKALLEKMELYPRRFELTDNLSGGMQRRVALIRALIHHPKVLFLDEPTTGLDPQARREIWEMIQEFKKSATVILTTHYMEEADILSDRIMMLHQGKVVMTGTPRELKQTIAPTNIYELVLSVPKTQEYCALFHQRGFESLEALDDYRLQFILDNPSDLQRVLAIVSSDEVERLGRLETDLETVFLKVASNQFSTETRQAS